MNNWMDKRKIHLYTGILNSKRLGKLLFFLSVRQSMVIFTVPKESFLYGFFRPFSTSSLSIELRSFNLLTLRPSDIRCFWMFLGCNSQPRLDTKTCVRPIFLFQDCQNYGSFPLCFCCERFVGFSLAVSWGQKRTLEKVRQVAAQFPKFTFDSFPLWGSMIQSQKLFVQGKRSTLPSWLWWKAHSCWGSNKAHSLFLVTRNHEIILIWWPSLKHLWIKPFKIYNIFRVTTHFKSFKS